MNENLVAQNPRDSIILLREKRLQEIREAKTVEAQGSYDKILRKFSKQFFKDDTTFDQLNPLQKKELAKFCASHCRKWLLSWILPIGSSLGTILFLGIFSSYLWFWDLLLWALISFISLLSVGSRKDKLDHVNFEHFWPFLRAYKKIIRQEEKRPQINGVGLEN